MRFLSFSNHENGDPRQDISKWSTICSTFSRSGWSVGRSASLAKGGTSKKRPSLHLHKVPTRSNKVSPRTLLWAKRFVLEILGRPSYIPHLHLHVYFTSHRNYPLISALRYIIETCYYTHNSAPCGWLSKLIWMLLTPTFRPNSVIWRHAMESGQQGTLPKCIHIVLLIRIKCWDGIGKEKANVLQVQQSLVRVMIGLQAV
jgi:hypothetical protein